MLLRGNHLDIVKYLIYSVDNNVLADVFTSAAYFGNL